MQIFSIYIYIFYFFFFKIHSPATLSHLSGVGMDVTLQSYYF